MKYNKKYIKEKWESIKRDMENILLSNEEDNSVDFPEDRMIRENLNENWSAIKKELKL